MKNLIDILQSIAIFLLALSQLGQIRIFLKTTIEQKKFNDKVIEIFEFINSFLLHKHRGSEAHEPKS